MQIIRFGYLLMNIIEYVGTKHAFQTYVIKPSSLYVTYEIHITSHVANVAPLYAKYYLSSHKDVLPLFWWDISVCPPITLVTEKNPVRLEPSLFTSFWIRFWFKELAFWIVFQSTYLFSTTKTDPDYNQYASNSNSIVSISSTQLLS